MWVWGGGDGGGGLGDGDDGLGRVVSVMGVGYVLSAMRAEGWVVSGMGVG